MDIDQSLDRAYELISKVYLIRNDTDPQSIKEAVDLYAEIFDLLMKDSAHEDNLFNRIQLAQPNQVQRYVIHLRSLNTLIYHMDSGHPLKELLQERWLDNVNLTSIEKFERQYKSNPAGTAASFIAENRPINVANTVEVRTWGTEREYSNGFRNVIDQKLRDDNVGHASVVMRLTADEENLRLVRQYCMDEKGKVIIPHELKKIGNQVIYEIYWSYWPGRLHNMEEDYEHERRGLEYRDIDELDKSVPKELSERYVVHKFRKGRIIPFAAPSERVTFKETGSERANFLALKEKEIKLQEEIETIDVMLGNYLAAGKPYSPTTLSKSVKVKKDSNFYEILARFKSQIQPRSLSAKILYNQMISPNEAKQLKNTFETLKKEKANAITKTHAEIEEVSLKIQASYEKASYLQADLEKATQTHLSGSLEELIKQKEEIGVLKEYLIQHQDDEYPISLPENIKDGLNKFVMKNTSLEDQIDDKAYLQEIIEDCFFYENQLSMDINTLKEDEVSKLMRKKIDLFKKEREYVQKELEEQAIKIEQKIENLNEQIKELDAVVMTLPIISSKDLLIQKSKEITQLEKDLKELKKIMGNFQGEQDFSYKLGEENITINLKTIEDATELQTKIATILATKKQEKLTLLEKIKVAKPLSQAKNSAGEPLIVHSVGEVVAAKKSIQKELNNLLAKQESFQENMQVAKLKSTMHLSEITQKQIRRGYPYKSSTLKGLNIEEMLKVARSLAGTVGSFDLRIENCSTTSMKLLKAGSPDARKRMFTPSKPPTVLSQYTLEIKSDDSSLELKPHIMYIRRVGNKIACSFLDKDDVKRENLLLTSVVAPPTVGPNELEYLKNEILEETGERGFTDKLEYDNDSFLTNPQAVYSAARVYERIDLGDKQAVEIAERVLNPSISDQAYNQLINKLSAMTNTELENISWLKLIGVVLTSGLLFKLYNDYFNTIKEKNSELVAVESQLGDVEVAIRDLSIDKKYHYINDGTPEVAINKMLEVLNSSRNAIQFFTREKLEEVNNYIMSIEQKDKPSNEEKAILKAFDKIIAERDNRVTAVEKALANGRDVNTQLVYSFRNSKVRDMKFPFTEQYLAQHKVDIFIKKYNEEKNPFSEGGFANRLDDFDTAEEKLAFIEKHIKDKPNSLSAEIWETYVETDPLCAKSTQREESSIEKSSREIFEIIEEDSPKIPARPKHQPEKLPASQEVDEDKIHEERKGLRF